MNDSYRDAEDCPIRLRDSVVDSLNIAEGTVIDLAAGMVLVDWGDDGGPLWEEPWDLYVL